MLWVDAAESDTLKRMGIGGEPYAERRAAFRNLRYVTLPAAGHMLHHDQPEELARHVEAFLADGG